MRGHQKNSWDKNKTLVRQKKVEDCLKGWKK